MLGAAVPDPADNLGNPKPSKTPDAYEDSTEVGPVFANLPVLWPGGFHQDDLNGEPPEQNRDEGPAQSPTPREECAQRQDTEH